MRIRCDGMGCCVDIRGGEETAEKVLRSTYRKGSKMSE